MSHKSFQYSFPLCGRSQTVTKSFNCGQSAVFTAIVPHLCAYLLLFLLNCAHPLDPREWWSGWNIFTGFNIHSWIWPANLFASQFFTTRVLNTFLLRHFCSFTTLLYIRIYLSLIPYGHNTSLLTLPFHLSLCLNL